MRCSSLVIRRCCTLYVAQPGVKSVGPLFINDAMMPLTTPGRPCTLAHDTPCPGNAQGGAHLSNEVEPRKEPLRRHVPRGPGQLGGAVLRTCDRPVLQITTLQGGPARITLKMPHCSNDVDECKNALVRGGRGCSTPAGSPALRGMWSICTHPGLHAPGPHAPAAPHRSSARSRRNAKPAHPSQHVDVGLGGRWQSVRFWPTQNCATGTDGATNPHPAHPPTPLPTPHRPA